MRMKRSAQYKYQNEKLRVGALDGSEILCEVPRSCLRLIDEISSSSAIKDPVHLSILT